MEDGALGGWAQDCTLRARPAQRLPRPVPTLARDRGLRFPLCRRGKLCLVLDLDHTLLNSCTYDELEDAGLAADLDGRARAEVALPHAQRQLFCLDGLQV